MDVLAVSFWLVVAGLFAVILVAILIDTFKLNG